MSFFLPDPAVSPVTRTLGGLLLSLLAMASTATAQNRSPVIETDPLAWLRSNLSCGELTDQFRARYAPLGRFADLPEEKKEEVRGALDIICSQKYTHCNLAGCKNLPRSDNSDSSADTPPADEVDSLAGAELEQRLAEKKRSAQNEMSRVKNAEAAQKRTWERIVMDEEQERLKGKPDSDKPKTPSTPYSRPRGDGGPPRSSNF